MNIFQVCLVLEVCLHEIYEILTWVNEYTTWIVECKKSPLAYNNVGLSINLSNAAYTNRSQTTLHLIYAVYMFLWNKINWQHATKVSASGSVITCLELSHHANASLDASQMTKKINITSFRV